MAALRAPARGTARLALTKHEVALHGKSSGKSPGAGTGPGAVAVSSKYPLVAAVDDEWSWGTCTGQADLLLLDFAGAEVARLPLFSHAEMTTDESDGCPFRRAAKAKIGRASPPRSAFSRISASRRPPARRGPSPPAIKATPGLCSRAPSSVSSSAATGFRALRGDDELAAIANPGAEQIRAATHLADANVVFLRWGRGGREGCEGSDPQGILVLPLRGAATGTPAER